MSINLIIEDGSIIENANSYIDLDFADNFHNNHGSENWLSIESEIEKERNLIKAAFYIDLKYKSRFKGKKINNDQYLEWPRENVFIDDYKFDNNKIPLLLKQAQAEAANHIENLFITNTNHNIDSISTGSLNISFKDVSNYPEIQSINYLIQPLLFMSMNNTWIYR